MKKSLVLAVLLAALGLSVSLLLILRPPELALIQYKDKDFEAARETYQRAFDAGKLTPEVVNALIDLHLQQGAVNDAITVLEKFITANPTDLSARKRLGTLYQYAQRPDDYLKNLEEMNRLAPSADMLAELSQIYNSRSDYARQVEALQRLIATEKNANPQHYRDLANILAAQHDTAGAAEALLKLREKSPKSMSFQETELLVSLLLDTQRMQEAYDVSAAWRKDAAKLSEVARLINLLHYRGSAEWAERLMNTYDDASINADPSLLEEKILLLLATGREEEGYTRLKGLYAQNALSPEMHNRLLFLAVARDDRETADALLAALDLSALTEPQAMALLELALSRGDGKLKSELTRAYAAEEYRTAFPLMSALVAAARGAQDAPQRLSDLDRMPLTAAQLIQSARICVRMAPDPCGARMLSRLPQPDALTDAEVAAVASLYFDMRQYEKGDAFLHAAGERDSEILREAQVRFSAMRGDDTAVAAWLDAHPQASARTLTNLFFAARNGGRHAVSARIAETLHGQVQSVETRTYLASAYVSSGAYEKAVALLRDAHDLSAADESNYLMALTRLSKNSAEYRHELGQYAAARLNADLPAERKLGLVHALVDAGQIEVAMPYVRALALKSGGQWAWLYASELTKHGQHEEARQFWVTLAGQSSTTDAQRRGIAYSLLAGGDRADAEPIFRRLAAEAPAKSDAVRELLYLWGPRYTAEQLDWLGARYRAAPETELPQWAEYIGNGATADTIVPFAEQRYPDTLFAPAVLRAYLNGLAARGEWEEKHAPLLRALAEEGNVGLLRVYAQTAQQNGMKRPEREAYETLIALMPQDAQALHRLGLIAYGQADYAKSGEYLALWQQSPEAPQESAEDIASGLYYSADLLRRAKDPQAAEYYQKAVDVVEGAALKSPEALSQRAQALIALGREEEGLQAFEEAERLYPAHDVLRADHISALLGLKRYQEARALLADPLTRGEFADAAPSMPLPEGMIESADNLAQGREVLLTFTREGDDARQFAGNAETLSWVSYTADGYRQVLVAAKPGYVVQRARDAQGNDALVAIPAANDEMRRQVALRYELLAARAEIETGEVHAATQRLNTLLPEYPGDAQLLGFAANAENYGGNWARAQALLHTASAIAPENEDIALLARDIHRAHAPNVKADYEWVKRGRQYERIFTLSGAAEVAEHLSAGFVAQRNDVQAHQLRRADGRMGNASAHRERAEVYALYHDENGVRARASLFGNNDTFGLGLTYEFLNALGESGAGVEYRRPYWEYVEGVLDDATRDRISVWHTIKPDTRVALRVEPGLNRYNVNSIDGVAKTWSLDARAIYRPIEDQPYFYLGYGLSAEYLLSRDRRVDSAGMAYYPLPVRSREVHFLSLNMGYELSADTYADGMVGYGYDRLGGSGPIVEGRITHELTPNLDAQLRASYGLDTQQSGNDITRVGAYARWRF